MLRFWVQVSTIEFSLIEVSVLHGLKQGNDVLKEIHKEMNIESIERLLDESHEAQAYQRVRNLLCSTPILLKFVHRRLMRCSQINSQWTMKTLYKKN